MRVTTTERGVETRLNVTDFRLIKSILKWLDPLVAARPLVPAYTQSRDGLREIQRMFGQEVRLLEEFRVSIEGQNGSDQPDPATDDTGQSEGTDGAEADPLAAGAADVLVTKPFGTTVTFDGSDDSPIIE